MVMIYMGGHVSGAHYNPAISIAILLRGKMDAKDLGPYIVAQLLGAIAGAALVKTFTGDTLTVAPGEDASVLAILLAEVLFTFALALVILNVATSKKTEGNSYYGLAIGFTVTAGAVAVGGISGGAFNPAVGIGPILIDGTMGDGGFGNLWYYLVGPIVGACLATAVFSFQEGSDS